ncbi:MAG: hypothetical protein NC177_05630 [Ruminococcus flavefaciens]|nr:hypothetical protein [Ruminococcus flavefaciens]
MWFPVNYAGDKLEAVIKINSDAMITSVSESLMKDLMLLLDYRWKREFYHPAKDLGREDKSRYIKTILVFFNVYGCTGFTAGQLIHIREMLYNFGIQYQNYIEIMYEYCNSKYKKNSLNNYFDKIKNQKIRDCILKDILFLISCGRYDSKKEYALLIGVAKLYAENKNKIFGMYEKIRTINLGGNY